MKKTTTRRIMSLVLVAAFMLSTFATVNPVVALAASKITSLTVKTKTTNEIREGQVLTKKMVKSAVKVSIERKNGKKTSNYTGYTCSQIGKVVKPITSKKHKGKFKLTIKAGSKKKSVYVKVNKLTKLTASTKLTLTEGASFSEKEFKEKTTVKGSYKKGKSKDLTTYTVSAGKTVTRNSKGYFVVTVKYGKLSCKVNVPVEKKPEDSTSKPSDSSKADISSKADSSSKADDSSKADISSKADSSSKADDSSKADSSSKADDSSKADSSSKADDSSKADSSSKADDSSKPSDSSSTKTVTVIVNGNGYGLVTIDGSMVRSKEVAIGTVVTVTATPESGSKFVSWKDLNGKTVSSYSTYSFEVQKDTVLIANFEKIESSSHPSESSSTPPAVVKYSVTGIVNGNGKINGSKLYTQEVENGKTISLTAVEDTGNEFVNWTDSDGNLIGSSKTISLNVRGNVVVVANFKVKPAEQVEITIKRSGQGTVLLNGVNVNFTNNSYKATVVKGSSVTVVASSTGFLRWTDGSREISTNTTYTFTADSNKTVQAVFNSMYTLTVNMTAGTGTVSLDGTMLTAISGKATTQVVAGTYNLSAVAADNYKFNAWRNASGVLLTSNNPYRITIAGDTTLTAEFVAKSSIAVTYHYQGVPFTTQNVSSADEITSHPEAPYKSNLDFKGWKIGTTLYSDSDIEGAIKALINGGATEVSVEAYYEAADVYHTITIVGGTLQDANGNVISSSVKHGTTVYAVAEVADGESIYWKDSSNQVWGVNMPRYGFNANNDMTLTAVKEAIEVKQVAWKGEPYEFSKENQKIFFNLGFTIPEGWIVSEWGVLYYYGTSLNDFDYSTLSTSTEIKKFFAGDPGTNITANTQIPVKAGIADQVANGGTAKAKPFAIIYNSTTQVTEEIYGGKISIDFGQLMQ